LFKKLYENSCINIIFHTNNHKKTFFAQKSQVGLAGQYCKRSWNKLVVKINYMDRIIIIKVVLWGANNSM